MSEYIKNQSVEWNSNSYESDGERFQEVKDPDGNVLLLNKKKKRATLNGEVLSTDRPDEMDLAALIAAQFMAQGGEIEKD